MQDPIVTKFFDPFIRFFDKPIVLSPMVNRPNYGLAFTKTGKIIYHFNGKEYLSDPFHAVFLPIHSTYYLEALEPSASCVFNFLCIPDFNETEIQSIEIKSTDFYWNMFKNIQRVYATNNQSGKFECLSMLYHVFSQLFNTNVKTNGKISLAKQYMQEHFAESDLSIDTVSGITMSSNSNLRRVFHEEENISPKAYLTNIRINHAMNLLQTTTESVTSIAESCGFSSVYYFCKAFSKSTGCSPTKYRNKFHNRNI